MAVDLLVVGASHRTAELELRERLAFAEDAQPDAVFDLARLPSVGEALLLSTCNRVEVFATTREGATSAAAVAEIRAWLAASRGVPADELATHLYERLGPEAVRHVFRVAASLDSLVVGEPQILGQLKAAFAVALETGAMGPVLGRCVERAFGVAKRVRSETQIARGGANVSSVAVELARSIFGDLAGRKLLVIGAGKMADLAARHLAADGAADIVVTNRSEERGQALAARVGGRARQFAELEALLAESDIVLSSTGSSEPIIDRALVKRVMKARRNRPIFLIDIAVPRDVEHEVGRLDGVYLYDVDDLERVVDGNLAGRRDEAAAAETIVAAETAEYLAWLAQLGVVPTIRELRERFLSVAQADADRVVKTLAGRLQGLSADQERLVRQMAESIAKHLLQAPCAALKEPQGADAEALVAATRRLFALAEGEAPAAADAPVAEAAGEPEAEPAEPRHSTARP